MPTRLLRDWTDSLRFDGISPEAERLFVRLIMKVDDYGRFHADPRLVRGACFPLTENLRTNDLIRWLDELSTRQLILRYEAGTRVVLAITNFGQRLRASRAKFPPPTGKPDDWLPVSEEFHQLAEDPGDPPRFPEKPRKSRNAPAVRGDSPQVAASCGKSPPESDVHSDTETKADTEPPGPPGGGWVVDGIAIPDSLRTESFVRAWSEWIVYRKALKKGKCLPQMFEYQLKKLSEVGPEVASKMLAESIRNGWQGLFDLKPNEHNTRNPVARNPQHPGPALPENTRERLNLMSSPELLGLGPVEYRAKMAELVAKRSAEHAVG